MRGDVAGRRAGDGRLAQIMYGIDGRQLCGERCRPRGVQGRVRFASGKRRYNHLQLTSRQLRRGICRQKDPSPPWVDENRPMIDGLRPGARGRGHLGSAGVRQEFLYSRVMCWVALDRAIPLAGKRSFPAPLARWQHVRDTICRDIYERFWDPARHVFVQTPGSRALDASALLMPLIRFVSPTDARWLSTLRAIEQDLVSDSRAIAIASATPPTGSRARRACFPCGTVRRGAGPAAQHNFPQAFTHLAVAAPRTISTGGSRWRPRR